MCLLFRPPTAHEYNINKARHMNVGTEQYLLHMQMISWSSQQKICSPPHPSLILRKQKSAAAILWWTEKNIIRRDGSRNKNKQLVSDIGANPGLVPIHQVVIRACMILIWFAALFEEVLIQEINNYQLNLGAGDSFVNPLSLGFGN